jgi:hypothetical protein
MQRTIGIGIGALALLALLAVIVGNVVLRYGFFRWDGTLLLASLPIGLLASLLSFVHGLATGASQRTARMRTRRWAVFAIVLGAAVLAGLVLTGFLLFPFAVFFVAFFFSGFALVNIPVVAFFAVPALLYAYILLGEPYGTDPSQGMYSTDAT